MLLTNALAFSLGLEVVYPPSSEVFVFFPVTAHGKSLPERLALGLAR